MAGAVEHRPRRARVTGHTRYPVPRHEQASLAAGASLEVVLSGVLLFTDALPPQYPGDSGGVAPDYALVPASVAVVPAAVLGIEDLKLRPLSNGDRGQMADYMLRVLNWRPAAVISGELRSPGSIVFMRMHFNERQQPVLRELTMPVLPCALNNFKPLKPLTAAIMSKYRAMALRVGKECVAGYAIGQFLRTSTSSTQHRAYGESSSTCPASIA